MGRTRLLYLAALLGAGMLYLLNGAYVTLFPILWLLCGLLLGAAVCLAGGRRLNCSWETAYAAGDSSTHSESSSEMEVQDNCSKIGRIQIQNRSWLPVFHGRLELLLENRLTGEQWIQSLPFAVLPKGRAEVEVKQAICCCGAYRVSSRKARIYDMFCVFCAERKMEIQAEVLVYPTIEPVKLTILQKEHYDMESFRYAESRSGDDATETFDIREYQSGDSIRKIHWKLTGKMDTLMIRESSYPVFHSILLLLETGYEAGRRPEAEQIDAAVSVFLSVAQMLTAQKLTFGIGFLDYEKETFCVQRIETQEELWNVIPELLHAGSASSEYSVYEQYQLWHGDQNYAQYICVSAGNSYEDHYMENDDAVRILRCADTCGQKEREVCFTVKNWKEELA